MAFTETERLDIEKLTDIFLNQIRPAEDIRNQIDFGYRMDEQSLILFETRPNKFLKSISVSPFAKAVFVKTENLWKVYWQRADMKWHSYKPIPTVKTINDFFKLVESDKHHCFFG
jgi:hypothetical protein